MTDKAALKEIARQEKRFAAANCGSSYAKATEDRTRAVAGKIAREKSQVRGMDEI